MQKSLLALAVAATVTAATPAASITFPSLTTIYVAAGVEDSGGFSTDTALAVFCSNVSGQTASVRILILSNTGGIELNVTRTLDHGEGHTFATQNITAIGEEILLTGAITGGTLNVESTQSGVFCSAYMMDTETNGPSGVALHLVRINPHPGAVE
jgi:hypothetical protein